MRLATWGGSVLLALGCGLPQAQADELPLIEIAEARWTQAVDSASRQPVNDLSSAVARRPLVLWMRLRAGDAALRRLEDAGRLPILHRWFRESFAGVQAEGVEMTDSIPLSAGNTSVLAALRHEVRERGHFDWRTWSYKARPGPGRWSVAVVYADRTPVLCDGKPCRFSITVK